MKDWKFFVRNQVKAKDFTNREKEVGNFHKTGTIMEIVII